MITPFKTFGYVLLLLHATLDTASAGEWTDEAACTNQWCSNGRTGPGRGKRSLIAIRPIFDDTANPCDVACMRDMLWGPEGSATHIAEASFGMVSFPEGFEGSTAVDVTLAGEQALLSGTCDSYTWRYAAIARAIVEHGLNAADFEHIVIFQPPSGACRNPGAAGGTWVHYFNGGAGTVTHELGHAVGMGHATKYDLEERKANPRSGEYQDGTSVMGRGGSANFNLPNRLAMNWIPETEVAQIYDADLEATCGGDNTVTAKLHDYRIQGLGPENSMKALVIKDCLDGFHWFISTNYDAANASPWGTVYLHRCNNPAGDTACRRTEIRASVKPPTGTVEGETYTVLGVDTQRFNIRVGVPDPTTGVVPVTVADCSCTVTSTTTTTTSVTTTTLFDPSALSNWGAGQCIREDNLPIDTFFLTDSAATECTDEGMRAIASADECEKACYTVGKNYRPGNWDYQPTGCFRMSRGKWTGNCHWNVHQDPIKRDYDDVTAFSRLVCTDKAATTDTGAGSRQHPDSTVAAADCGAWCKDPSVNPGAVGCEFIFKGAGSLKNGCFAIYDEELLGGDGQSEGSFCVKFPPVVVVVTEAPPVVCEDDDAKMADQGQDDVMNCEDAGKFCEEQSAFGDAVREFCCATCAAYVPPATDAPTKTPPTTTQEPTTTITDPRPDCGPERPFNNGYIGCFADNRNRDFDNGGGRLSGSGGGADFEAMCRTQCKNGGFKFFALQSPPNPQCFCGDAYSTDGSAYDHLPEAAGTDGSAYPKRPEGECTSDGKQLGGGWRNAVYEVTPDNRPSSVCTTTTRGRRPV